MSSKQPLSPPFALFRFNKVVCIGSLEGSNKSNIPRKPVMGSLRLIFYARHRVFTPLSGPAILHSSLVLPPWFSTLFIRRPDPYGSPAGSHSEWLSPRYPTSVRYHCPQFSPRYTCYGRNPFPLVTPPPSSRGRLARSFLEFSHDKQPVHFFRVLLSKRSYSPCSRRRRVPISFLSFIQRPGPAPIFASYDIRFHSSHPKKGSWRPPAATITGLSTPRSAYSFPPPNILCPWHPSCPFGRVTHPPRCSPPPPPAVNPSWSPELFTLFPDHDIITSPVPPLATGPSRFSWLSHSLPFSRVWQVKFVPLVRHKFWHLQR